MLENLFEWNEQKVKDCTNFSWKGNLHKTNKSYYKKSAEKEKIKIP